MVLRIIGRLFILLLLFSGFAFAQSAESDFTLQHTRYFKTGEKDSYEIYAGDISAENEADYEAFVKKFVTDAQAADPEFYFEVTPISVEQEFDEGRTPQAVKSKRDAKRSSNNLLEFAKKSVNYGKKIVVKPLQKAKGDFAHWMRNDENRIRFTFTMIAGSVDGVMTSATLLIFQGVSTPAALTVGATVAAMSATWSLYTPQLAEFFNGKPSIVSLIAKQKQNLLTKGGRWFEGMLKWGIVSGVYFGVLTGVSHSLDIVTYSGFREWFLVTVGNATLTTQGQGLFDYSLSVELNEELSKHKHDAAYRKLLRKSYILGTAAASITALAGLGSVLGYEFADYTLKGLAALGVLNLIRVEKDSILAFFKSLKTGCNVPMSKSGRKKGFESWGSE